MLKCGKNKKVAYGAETSESLIKCFYHILTSSVTYYLSTDPQQLGKFLFEIKKSQKLLMMTLSLHLSCNRSLVRTNQIVKVIQLIM